MTEYQGAKVIATGLTLDDNVYFTPSGRSYTLSARFATKIIVKEDVEYFRAKGFEVIEEEGPKKVEAAPKPEEAKSKKTKKSEVD